MHVTPCFLLPTRGKAPICSLNSNSFSMLNIRICPLENPAAKTLSPSFRAKEVTSSELSYVEKDTLFIFKSITYMQPGFSLKMQSCFLLLFGRIRFPPMADSITTPPLPLTRVSTIQRCFGLRDVRAMIESLFNRSKSLNFYSFVFIKLKMGTVFVASKVSNLCMNMLPSILLDKTLSP